MDAKQQQVVDQYEHALRLQMAKIDQLRAEIKNLVEENKNLVEWANGDRDALSRLQRTYNDPKVSDGNRIRAASAAIAFERPKLTVNVQVGPALLGERLDHARLNTGEPKLIEHHCARVSRTNFGPGVATSFFI